MNNEIYDIFTINQVSIFPLAAGYYYLLGFILIFSSLFLFYKKFNVNNSQKKLAINIIKKYSKKATLNNEELYFLIKKLALYKFGRSNVAKLSGTKLLDFLAKNDSSFNWPQEAKFINNLYAKNALKKINNYDNILKNLKKWF
ncbi:MAG: DUF4381 domain-containing protein [Rickettsiales bacterium]